MRGKILIAISMLILFGHPLAGMAADGGEPARYDLQIERLPLGEALQEFAKQSGVQVIFFSRVTDGLQAPALRGRFTAQAALQRLLGDSRLTFRELNPKTIEIRPMAALDGSEATHSSVTSAQPIRLAAMSEGDAADGQENGQAQPTDGGAPPQPQRPDETQGIGEVVVTGSHIARESYETSTPTTIIDRRAIQNTGFNNLGEVLLEIPSVGIGLSSATSNFNGDNDASTFVNLRGLGTDRTLTLVNGRRRVAGSGASSAVDLNTIPAAMVDRIDVITGGAAAVYGADAVSGVVNVILRRDFEGLEVSARDGVAEHGGAGSYSINLFGGMRFNDDKGSLSFGASYNDENPLFGPERSFSRKWISLVPNPANTGPNDGITDLILIRDTVLPDFTTAGTFYIGDTRYTYNPGLRTTQNGPLYYGGSVADGGEGFSYTHYDQLRIKREAFATHTSFDYRLSERVSLFSEAEFSRITAVDSFQSNFEIGQPIQRDNPFVAADLGALMDANGVGTIFVSRQDDDQGLLTESTDKASFTAVAGLKGTFANDWSWQTFYQYGWLRTDANKTSRIEARWQAAVDAIADPLTGDPICRSEAARAEGCVALNILGENVATQAAIDYFRHQRMRGVTNTQEITGAQLTGKLFELPAGDLRFATGLEYRRERLETRPDGLAVTGQLWPFDSLGEGFNGSFEVKEAFAEFVTPLLADKPFANALNFELAGRLSDYSTINKTKAWKVAGDWSPVSDVRFRATRTRSVRAPNLTELFIPTSIVNQFNQDPCDASLRNANSNRDANCAALGAPVDFVDLGGQGNFARVGGNPDLQEETSNALTVGIILTPSAIPRLSLSVDYWKIDIDNAINDIGIQTIVDRCVDLPTTDNQFCPLVHRGSDFVIDYVDVREINVSTLLAKGIDVQSAYSLPMPSLGILPAGNLRILVNGTYLITREQQVDPTDPGSLVVDTGAGGFPRVRANLTLGYVSGGVSADFMTRYVGHQLGDRDAAPEEREANRAGAKIYNDLVLAYTLQEKYRLHLGINNLFDVIPPRIPEFFTGGGNTAGPAGALYDNIGRYFFFGASMRL